MFACSLHALIMASLVLALLSKASADMLWLAIQIERAG